MQFNYKVTATVRTYMSMVAR